MIKVYSPEEAKDKTFRAKIVFEISHTVSVDSLVDFADELATENDFPKNEVALSELVQRIINKSSVYQFLDDINSYHPDGVVEGISVEAV